MPTYTYKCEWCGARFERVVRIKEHKPYAECICGESAKQTIEYAPMVVIPEHMRWNAQAYTSPIDGRPITTKRQHIEDMARNDCIEYEPGMKQDVNRRVIESDKELDKLVDETIDREIASMPAVKLERLDAELSAGMTAEPIRL